MQIAESETSQRSEETAEDLLEITGRITKPNNHGLLVGDFG